METVGTKGTSGSAPGGRTAWAGLGPTEEPGAPEEKDVCPEWGERWEPRERMSQRSNLMPRANPVRSQVQTSQGRRSESERWIPGQNPEAASGRVEGKQKQSVWNKKREGVWCDIQGLSLNSTTETTSPHLSRLFIPEAHTRPCTVKPAQVVSGGLFLPDGRHCFPTDAQDNWAPLRPSDIPWLIKWHTWARVPVLLVKMKLTYIWLVLTHKMAVSSGST